MGNDAGVASNEGSTAGESNQTALPEGTAQASQANSRRPEDYPVKIGVLQFMAHPSLDEIHQGLMEGLAARGFRVGENVRLEDLNGQGEQANLKMMADQLVSDGCQYLVGIATPAAQALATASNGKIPQVFSAVTDPVAAGLVESMERPGGLNTGTSDALPMEEQMELLLSLMPAVKTVGFLYTTSEPASKSQVDEAERTLKAKGIATKTATIATTNDLAQVAEQLAGEVEAIFVPNDNTIAAAMNTLIPITDAKKIPVFVPAQAMVEAGGLATTGVMQKQIGVDTANMLADAIEGRDVRSTPVFKSIQAEVYVNEAQASKLGIKIPQAVRTKMRPVSIKETKETKETEK